MTRPDTPLLLVIASLCLLASACATPSPAPQPQSQRAEESHHFAPPDQASVVQAALSMVGRPYKWGGRSPAGFDCSGLVLYSYSVAGTPGLPHSVARLQDASTALRIADAEPGDLLFFSLTGKKSSHVAIYTGERHFVHAPSSGKTVERVSFDHVYWGAQLKRASAGRVRIPIPNSPR